jgi:hypothetical protein
MRRDLQCTLDEFRIQRIDDTVIVSIGAKHTELSLDDAQRLSDALLDIIDLVDES